MEPDPPLAKLEHHAARAEWLAHRGWALAALALGVIAFVVAAATEDHLGAAPDARITLPGLALTAAAAGASVLRREKAYPIWLAGLGFAAAGAVLGWVLMLALVAAGTAIVIAILHFVM